MPIMSSHVRPTLAALLGLAALSTSAPAAAELPSSRAGSTPSHIIEAAVATEADRPSDSPTLRTLIEARIADAEREHRYDDIDALTTLWLTLEKRSQLDRVVNRGHQFLNVSLRNQRRSELRSTTRRQRFAPYDVQALDVPAPRWTADERLDAERFVSHLEEPYRSAVLWSLTGRNHREVADEMQVSHAAVRKWAQRLRERLADDGDELS
jgi:DNA-directed RNA polymerase specialized sigma24 family protein